MRLDEILRLIQDELTIEKITFDQYRRCVARFAAYLGRPPTVEHLNLEECNAFLRWLPVTYGIGPQSVKNYRTALLRVWNYAGDVGLAKHPHARRLRMPRVPQRRVQAWSRSNIGALLAAASTLPGRLRNGISAADFLVAWILVGYDTGLRPGDLRLLDWPDVDLDSGTISLTQHKTGQLHGCRIGEAATAALLTLAGYALAPVFPLDKSGVYRWERILYQHAAGAGFRRRTRQGIGTLRKSHATEIYRLYGLSAASESLGHSGSTQTARNHYIASETHNSYLPPAIGE